MLTVTDGAKHDWGSMPLKEMAIGNAMDCDFTLRSWKILKSEMKTKGVNFVYENLLSEVAVLLSAVEFRGIKVDVDYLTELEVKLKKVIAKEEVELQSLCGIEGVNPNSSDDMGIALFTEEGFDLNPTEFSAKAKKPAITEAHLTSLSENSSTSTEARTFITKLLKYKGLSKLYRTYVKGVESATKYNEENRIYSSYNFGATVTGRLSCSMYSAGPSKKKGVSFHTLPRTVDDDTNIRRLMRADDDKVFIAADFGQAELRMLAQCCRDKELIHAFNSGTDLHKYTASLIYGKSIDKVTKQERQVAKSVSFLIVYGGGPFKLASQIGKSVGYCKNIFKEYQQAFPKVFDWINSVHRSVRDNGYAVSLFGRRRNLSNVNSPIKKYQFRALRQGMNFVIQSSASDMMLHAIKRLDERLREENLDAEILATVHDSVEIQCSKSDTKRVLEVVRESLTDTSYFYDLYKLKFLLPFEVDIEVGKSFGELMAVEFSDQNELLQYDEIERYIENI
jgi:DNA polymerase-1